MIEIEKPKIEWVNKDGEQHGRFVVEPLSGDTVLPSAIRCAYYCHRYPGQR